MNSSAQPSRRIASNLLWTPQGLLRNPLVGVAADGRILFVGTCPEPDRSPGTEFYAGVLAPGLVNAHCHLELSYLLGAIPERCGFAGFAGAMSQVRERFSAEQRAQAVEAADAAMWQAGIEAVGDISNGDATFAVKSRSRIAYRTFVEFFGLRAASAEHLLPLLRHPQTSLTPHSLYSVQDAPLRAIAARGDAPLSIHFMETPAEAELFEQRGELWEWYRKAGFTCDFLHYGSHHIKFDQACGLLGTFVDAYHISGGQVFQINRPLGRIAVDACGKLCFQLFQNYLINHAFRNIISASGIDRCFFYCRNQRRNCFLAFFIFCLHSCYHVFS